MSVERTQYGTYRVRYRTDDGRDRSKSFKRKVDADDFDASVRVKKRTGEFIDPVAGKRLFGDVAEEWRQGQLHRPTTAEQVASIFRRHLIPAFGDQPIGHIRPSQVQAWVGAQSKKLSPSTVETQYRYLSAIFRSSVRDRIIPASPCVDISLPKKGRSLVDPLPTDVVERLVNGAGDDLRALVVLAAGTGLRLGECLGLTVDRIDFLRRHVTVDRQLVTVGGQTDWGPPKTESSYRRVPLPQVVVDELAAHLKTHEEGDERLVFHRDGAMWPRNRFHPHWDTARCNAGCDGVKFHDLRHYYASLLIASGESVKAVQARLGHASASETLDTYSHLWPDSEDSTRAAVDAVLGHLRDDPSVQKVSGLVG